MLVVLLATAAIGAKADIHASEVCFQGDHLAQIAPLLKRLKYKLVAPEATVDANAAQQFISAPLKGRNRVRKLAYLDHGWTHVFDPELVMFDDDLKSISKNWHTTIVSWVCEFSSRSLGFRVIKNGSQLREVLVVDGKADSKGKPLPQEAKTNWSTAAPQDLLNLINRLGPTYRSLAPGIRYHTFDLDE